MRKGERIFVGGLFTTAASGAAWFYFRRAEKACRAQAEVLETVRCLPESASEGIARRVFMVAGAITAVAGLVSLFSDEA